MHRIFANIFLHIALSFTYQIPFNFLLHQLLAFHSLKFQSFFFPLIVLFDSLLLKFFLSTHSLPLFLLISFFPLDLKLQKNCIIYLNLIPKLISEKSSPIKAN